MRVGHIVCGASPFHPHDPVSAGSPQILMGCGTPEICEQQAMAALETSGFQLTSKVECHPTVPSTHPGALDVYFFFWGGESGLVHAQLYPCLPPGSVPRDHPRPASKEPYMVPGIQLG